MRTMLQCSKILRVSNTHEIFSGAAMADSNKGDIISFQNLERELVYVVLHVWGGELSTQ